MAALNQQVWNTHYLRDKSIQQYPDENIVRVLRKNYPENHAGSLALDLGTGSGRHLALLREHFSVVIAADYAHEALLQPAPTEFNRIQAQLPQLPFSENQFDFILCWGVLHYLPRVLIAQAIFATMESLKSGGRLFTTLRSTADTHLNTQIVRGDLVGGSAELFTKAEALEFFSSFSNLSYGFISRQPLAEETIVAHHMLLATK